MRLEKSDWGKEMTMEFGTSQHWTTDFPTSRLPNLPTS